jgi:hypothetical protein
MKRVLQILFGYVVFCFCLCLAAGFFTGTVPELLERSVRSYRLYAGLRYFCLILPAVALTGFTVGCAVSFGRNPEGSFMRFSPAMFQRYGHIMVVGLVCSFILTCTAEIGTPLLVSRQSQLAQMPKRVREYVRIGNASYDSGNPGLAFQYAQLAVKLDPKSRDALELSSKAELPQKTNVKPDIPDMVPEISSGVSEEGYSVSTLRKKAEEAYAKGNWFDAHYYAETGIAVASAKDTNVEPLKQTAAAAWNKLSQSEKPAETEDERIYKQKLEGYKTLMDGDNLKAYYIFRTLSQQSRALSVDPDVVRYLNLAGKRVAAESFFIDETFNVQEFENAGNVYFSLHRADGSVDVVYIKGVTAVKGSDGMVQYLRGLSIVSTDKDGTFLRSMHVEYAKLIEVPVSDLDKDTVVSLGLDPDVTSVPYLLLRSVDRDTEGVAAMPQYEYADKQGAADEVQMILPLSYDDFELLLEASAGPELMTIPSIFRFTGKAVRYGFSEEVFEQIMLNRSLYPLFILLIFILAAGFAWNYRIGEKLMFKTVWVAVFPIFSVVAYLLFKSAEWLYKLFNYVILGAAGTQSALAAGCGVYVGVLILVSLVFLSRNSADAA